MRHGNSSVFSLEILQNAHHDPWNSQGGRVECVKVKGLTFLVLGSQVQSAALVVGAVARTGDLKGW